MFSGRAASALGAGAVRARGAMAAAAAVATAGVVIVARDSPSWSAEDGDARTRVVVEYENKLRLFAEPEKRFNYFASRDDPAGRPCMTFEDFVICITPSLRRGADMHREGGWGLLTGSAAGASGSFGSRAKATGSERVVHLQDSALDLVDSSGDGLISFAEYLFCMALLTIPPSDFELAFRVFDVDGNGDIDADEFETAMERMRGRSSIAGKDRFAGELAAIEGNEKLMNTFFGKDRKGKLSVHQFTDFIATLQREVLHLEFSFLDQAKENSTSVGAFVRAMLVQPSEPSQPQSMQRPKSMAPVSFQEWMDFDVVLRQLGRVEEAVAIYTGNANRKSAPDLEANILLHLIQAATGIALRSDILMSLAAATAPSGAPDMINVAAFFSALKHRQRRFSSGERQATGLAGYFSCLRHCRIGGV